MDKIKQWMDKKYGNHCFNKFLKDWIVSKYLFFITNIPVVQHNLVVYQQSSCV